MARQGGLVALPIGLAAARVIIKGVAALTATWRETAKEAGARPAEITRMVDEGEPIDAEDKDAVASARALLNAAPVREVDGASAIDGLVGGIVTLGVG